MSPLGHRRTLRRVCPISALPLQADIQRRVWHVRQAPERDIGLPINHLARGGNEAHQLTPFERPGHRTLGLGDQLCFAPMDKDPGDDDHDHNDNY